MSVTPPMHVAGHRVTPIRATNHSKDRGYLVMTIEMEREFAPPITQDEYDTLMRRLEGLEQTIRSLRDGITVFTEQTEKRRRAWEESIGHIVNEVSHLAYPRMPGLDPRSACYCSPGRGDFLYGRGEDIYARNPDRYR